MNKKILLGAGILPLLILPAVAFTSCAKDETGTPDVNPDVITLQSEVKKYANLELQAVDNTLNWKEVKAMLYDTDNMNPLPNAIDTVMTLVKDFPVVSTGFSLELTGARQTVATGFQKDQLTLTIVITQTATGLADTVECNVNGLKIYA